MDGDQNFVWSVKNGDLSAVQSFVKNGGNVNALIGNRCPLHYAADYGQSEIIEYLLKEGANINVPDKFGITPLLSAVFEGHTESVRILLDKGADKSGKAPSGESYIDSTDNQEIKKLLK